MMIRREKTAALFIDYQTKLIPAQYNKDKFIENSAKLADGLIAMEVPIIVSEQYKKGLGDTIEELKNIEGFPEGLEKTSFSCLLNDDLKNALKLSGAKDIIICGCETHICVLQTVIDLIDLGYNVFIIDDCCTSRTLENHKIGMERAKQEGAFVSSLETVLFELLRVSGGETFKHISNLIK